MKIRFYDRKLRMLIIGVQRVQKIDLVKFSEYLIGKRDFRVVITILEFNVEWIHRMGTHRKERAQPDQ